MLFDTHAHLNFEAFENDWRETAKRALDAGIKIINVGSNLETSKKAVAIAEEFPDGVYAAVGLHPVHVLDEDIDIEEYKKLAVHPKVVALGEIGLDYFRMPSSIRPEGSGSGVSGRQIKSPTEIKNLQKGVLLEFLKLSVEKKLPVIVHCREAHADLIQLLENFDKPAGPDVRGVMHCFSGSFEEARRYLNLGFLISFTGVITFAHYEGEALAKIPLNKIMVETDCPYLTPEPHRGKRNEPLYVEFVAKEVARVKNESYEEVEKITTENARRLFSKMEK
ncbi:MAG: TatD family hydrolase [Patescibacteria group bacterium]|jgi:TatD DNase family protein